MDTLLDRKPPEMQEMNTPDPLGLMDKGDLLGALLQEPATAPLGLDRRICAVIADAAAAGVTMTGKNQYEGAAMSMGDVESAIAPLVAKHGIVTDYTFNEKPAASGKEWMVDLTVQVRNADNKDEYLIAHLFDVGMNVSAAVTFALKRYYKGLFHLADSSDDTPGQKTAPPARDQQQSRPPVAYPAATNNPDAELTSQQKNALLANFPSVAALQEAVKKRWPDLSLATLRQSHYATLIQKPDSKS